MSSKRVSAVSSLPAYGEENNRLDPTAHPPRYTFIADHDASSPAPQPTQSRYIGREYGQGANVIQHWQQEQRTTSKSRHGENDHRGLWASTVQKAKARKRTVMLLAVLLVICIVVVIVVPVLVVRNKNTKKEDITYKDAIPGTSLAVGIASATLNGTTPVALYAYQSFANVNGSEKIGIRLTADQPDTTVVYDVPVDGMKNMTGIALDVRDIPTHTIDTSVFYVEEQGGLRKIKNEGSSGGPNSTIDRLGWTPGGLKNYPFVVSETDMNLAASHEDVFDPAKTGAKRCNDSTGAQWVFYRPRNNLAVIQEVVHNPSTLASEVWMQGSTFEGIKTGSQLVTFVTQTLDFAGGVQKMDRFRWLYAIGDDGNLVGWACENCCLNTTGQWRKTTESYSLPSADPDSLTLAGGVEGDYISLYYRCYNGAICKTQSSYPPVSLRNPTPSDLSRSPTPGFTDGAPAVPNIGFADKPGAMSRIAVSQSDEGAKVVTLQQDEQGRLMHFFGNGAGRGKEWIPTGPPPKNGPS